MRTALALVLIAGCGSSPPAPETAPAPPAAEASSPSQTPDYVGLRVRDGRTDLPPPFSWMGETLLGAGDSTDRAVTYGREGDATVILLERVVGWEPIQGGRAPVWE